MLYDCIAKQLSPDVFFAFVYEHNVDLWSTKLEYLIRQAKDRFGCVLILFPGDSEKSFWLGAEVDPLLATLTITDPRSKRVKKTPSFDNHLKVIHDALKKLDGKLWSTPLLHADLSTETYADAR
jgi:hypothetical protein